MGNKIKSDFLVASPSFASGAARLLDWCGTFDQYNESRNAQEADAIAMASDWSIVGDDICDAMEQFQVAESVK
jgi:hypothetical protein